MKRVIVSENDFYALHNKSFFCKKWSVKPLDTNLPHHSHYSATALSCAVGHNAEIIFVTEKTLKIERKKKWSSCEEKKPRKIL